MFSPLLPRCTFCKKTKQKHLDRICVVTLSCYNPNKTNTNNQSQYYINEKEGIT